MPRHRRKTREPLLSTMGNPFPPGLTPVWSTIDQTSSGPVVNNLAEEWAQHPPPKQDYEGMVTTDEYLYVDFPPDDRAPRFKLRLQPKKDSETDEQYAWYRRGIEEHTRTSSVFMHVLQAICTWVGNHRTCRETVCRRERRCAARRDEDYYCITIAIYPPCIPFDPDVLWTYHTAAQDYFKDWTTDDDGYLRPPGAVP